MQRRNQTFWIPLLVGFLFLLLPALAVLQLNWIDALSEAETIRIANFVSTGAGRVAIDVEQELGTLRNAFRDVPAQPPQSIGEILQKRWHSWRVASEFPELIAEVIWINPDAPQLSLSRTNWGPEMAEWSKQIDALFDNVEAGSAGSIVVPSDPPGLLFPIGGEQVGATGKPNFALVLLNRDVLSSQLLAGLVDRHLGQPFGEPVHVWITLADQLVFASKDAPELPEEAQCDARVQVPGSRLELEVLSEGGRQVLLTRESGGREISVFAMETSRGTPELTNDLSFARTILSPSWEIRASHAAGSIAAAVTSARRRNLAMSFGTLSVLALTTVFLLLAARRSRLLAQRQIEFVAGVTHELRTPLTVIQSAAENLRDGIVGDPEQARRYGQLIYDEGRRLTELVESALALAGAHRGQAAPSPRSIELSAFLPAVLRHSWESLNQVGDPPAPQIPPGIPPVLADPLTLERALNNLIGNAIKYGGEAPEVGVRVSLSGPRHVDITVWDHGPGIPRDEQSRVFEPFFRGRSAREAQLPGSGLGLSVVQSVITASGGSVSVQSEPGKGSSFVLHLPVAAS